MALGFRFRASHVSICFAVVKTTQLVGLTKQKRPGRLSAIQIQQDLDKVHDCQTV